MCLSLTLCACTCHVRVWANEKAMFINNTHSLCLSLTLCACTGSGQPLGTFLLRFSSQPGCFASSFVTIEGVKHALIKRVPDGVCLLSLHVTLIFYNIRNVILLIRFDFLIIINNIQVLSYLCGGFLYYKFICMIFIQHARV